MRALASLLAGFIVLAAAPLVGAGPEGQITWAEHTTLVPAWLDPGEAMILTGALYALHDALVKPMPAGSLAPSLAESWSMSSNGLVYDFVLRKGARFHNGEPVTAEDVKFSYERYHGGFASALKEHVAGERRAEITGRVKSHSLLSDQEAVCLQVVAGARNHRYQTRLDSRSTLSDLRRELVFESRPRFRSNSSHITACLVPETATRLKHAALLDVRPEHMAHVTGTSPTLIDD
jgi:Bacterial extracellular solute-binding proteins, family 5 Middle